MKVAISPESGTPIPRAMVGFAWRLSPPYMI